CEQLVSGLPGLSKVQSSYSLRLRVNRPGRVEIHLASKIVGPGPDEFVNASGHRMDLKHVDYVVLSGDRSLRKSSRIDPSFAHHLLRAPPQTFTDLEAPPESPITAILHEEADADRRRAFF